MAAFRAVVSALLALGVAAVHVVDQEGFPGSRDPGYVGVGYYLLEPGAILVAAVLMTRRGRSHVSTWLLASALALGPIVGYCLSRGPGLPDHTEDRGTGPSRWA